MDIEYTQYLKRLKALQTHDFDNLALVVFQFQAKHNPLYARYLSLIHINPDEVSSIEEIPFLPIHFFKTHDILTGIKEQPPLWFESSGTTGKDTSRHWVAEKELYHFTLQQGFESQYGALANRPIFALLPSYLERQHASLVYMVKEWMKISSHQACGFYLKNSAQLYKQLQQPFQGSPLLIGVTYALLEFAERYPYKFPSNLMVMETGGMKGKREEITRAQVHKTLGDAWQLPTVHSEYGMTELLSQAYSTQDGIFICSPTLKVLSRHLDDPLQTSITGKGALNIIDLANLYSCAFIATEDVGEVFSNGNFTVQGRIDHSLLRGCSLLSA